MKNAFEADLGRVLGSIIGFGIVIFFIVVGLEKLMSRKSK